MKTVICRCKRNLILMGLSVIWSPALLGNVGSVHLLPLNCSELLPDEAPFVAFFESVAKAGANEQRDLARRMLKILALREKLASSTDWSQNENPVDELVRKTLCFYREQKDPLRTVTYNDPQIISYLKEAIKPLEAKVEDAIFLAEFEREQRMRYEHQIEKNREVIRTLEQQAQRDAKAEYSEISKNARRKARTQK
ncbi:MAG: hypothetical protein KDD51_16505 [Bdellovibrionales bacterium]|nr:hypothetical protein [Bdellovibrionales bacterium]